MADPDDGGVARITSLVDTQTGEFLDDGRDEDARYQRKPVARNPDGRLERWAATDPDGIRPATAEERAAWEEAHAKQAARAACQLRRVERALLWALIGVVAPPATVGKLRAVEAAMTVAWRTTPWEP
jgi:hypothetical protein